MLRDAGVALEVVPGITAALGAAASFGFPLTHRDHAQACTFVTGHLQDGATATDWAALARSNQTLVIYMGVTGLPEIVDQLLAAGLSADTPAALIYKATLPEQRLFATKLVALPQTAAQYLVKPPALVVIGSVLNLLAADLA